MKTLLLTVLALSISSSAFASEASEMKLVRELANRRISGADVKKEVTAFDNTEGNPCAEEGRTYLVNVKVSKLVPHYDHQNNPSPKRVWEDFKQYSITRAELLKGGDLSDDICME